MNGAESLVRTLIDSGIKICFTNPGTSELHTVAAMDHVPGMRMVLGLFEGVCTGAADGYARMKAEPAAVLLHLGPGLANGIANLHNAQKAHTPIVNIVGDHATFHLKYNAPLTSDIISLAKPVSTWVHMVATAGDVGSDTAEAIAAACTAPGGIATLILPADCAWNENAVPAKAPETTAPTSVNRQAVARIAALLRSKEPVALLATGPALMGQGLHLLERIQGTTNAAIFSQTFNARAQRGAGRFNVPRLPYAVPPARKALSHSAHLILVGAGPPASFFGYPDSDSLLTPPDCQIHTLASMDEDIITALTLLAEEVGAPESVPGNTPGLIRPALPSGPVTPEKIWATLAAVMPEDAIIVNESITSGRGEEKFMPNAPPHDWLDLTGGAIGSGLPLATGAALACPNRKVITMQADGSAMYTLQSLWTQAREKLDVVTVLFSNRSYAILKNELSRVGADSSGPNALSVLDIGNPDLNWVKLANAMGVEATSCADSESFARQLAAAAKETGPHLIEVVL